MHIQIPLIIRGDGGTYRLCEQRHELVVIHQEEVGLWYTVGETHIGTSTLVPVK